MTWTGTEEERIKRRLKPGKAAAFGGYLTTKPREGLDPLTATELRESWGAPLWACLAIREIAETDAFTDAQRRELSDAGVWASMARTVAHFAGVSSTLGGVQ